MRHSWCDTQGCESQLWLFWCRKSGSLILRSKCAGASLDERLQDSSELGQAAGVVALDERQRHQGGHQARLGMDEPVLASEASRTSTHH